MADAYEQIEDAKACVACENKTEAIIADLQRQLAEAKDWDFQKAYDSGAADMAKSKDQQLAESKAETADAHKEYQDACSRLNDADGRIAELEEEGHNLLQQVMDGSTRIAGLVAAYAELCKLACDHCRLGERYCDQCVKTIHDKAIATAALAAVPSPPEDK